MSVTRIAETSTQFGPTRYGVDHDRHFVSVDSTGDYFRPEVRTHNGMVWFSRKHPLYTYEGNGPFDGVFTTLLRDRPIPSWGQCTEDIEARIQAHSEHDLPYLRMEPDELIEFLTERGVEFTLINHYEEIAK